MDRKTEFILNMAKYSAYIAVLWITISIEEPSITGPLVPYIFVLALDSIRSYYLNEKLPSFSVPSLYIQAVLIFIYITLVGTPLGAILLIILVAESMLAYPRRDGERIFFISIIGFPVVNAAILYGQANLDWGNMVTILVNALFLFFAYAFSYMARGQLDEKQRAEQALAQLDRSRSDLEAAYHKLIDVSKEREQLAAVEERSRLARELHDTLAHTLTAIIVSLEAGRKLLYRDPQRALSEIDKSQDQARRGLDEVRLTVKALRSDNRDQIDFATAIKSLARDYAGSGIEIDLELEEDISLSSALETTLYRIIQEGITNSIRHSDASLIKVRLQRREGGLLLMVEDNGKGCRELTEGHGLRGIRERAAQLGGRVSFISPGSGGFLIKLNMGEPEQ